MIPNHGIIGAPPSPFGGPDEEVWHLGPRGQVTLLKTRGFLFFPEAAVLGNAPEART